MTQTNGRIIPMQSISNTSYTYDAAMLKEDNLLGKKLTEARKTMKLSQKELSEKLLQYNIQVSSGAISKWEKGDAMPNPYQLFGLCLILQISDLLSYFTGIVPEACDYTPELSQKGLNLLQIFKEALISSGQYAPRSRRAILAAQEDETEIMVFNEPAAAGPGNPLMDGGYEMISYPSSLIPEGTDFGVRISGNSMYPRYVDQQVVYVEKTSDLYSGEIGIFSYDGEAYIKKYLLEQPSAAEIEEYISVDGIVLPKITLLSLNRQCAHMDVHVKPEHDFQIIGRVLN